MYLVDIKRNGKPVYDARVNQSIDNYLVNDLKLPGRGFMLYINRPSVIIGKNQNVWAEVDTDYLHENDIELVRRTSGGGAVYHDLGNLVFENILVDDTSHFNDYAYFAEPVLKALQKLGLDVSMKENSSDLILDGKKFSGMTMFKNGNNLAAGGTVMYDLNVDAAKHVLTEDPAEKDKKLGVASKRSQIINLKDFLPNDMTIEDLREAILKEVFDVDSVDDIETYELNSQDWDIIDKRLADEYGTDEWNFGRNPGYDRYFDSDLANGKMGINFSIDTGFFTRFKFNPFFKVEGDLHAVEESLVGAAANEEGIKAAVSVGHLKNISESELTDFIVRSLQDNEGLIS